MKANGADTARSRRSSASRRRRARATLYAACGLAALSGCANAQSDKMSWTLTQSRAPLSPELLPSGKGGVGGGFSEADLAETQVISFAELAGVQEGPSDSESEIAPGSDGAFTHGPRQAAPSATGELTFLWPIAAIGVNSLFGEREDPFGHGRRFHAGVDLDGQYGSLVRAAADGVVVTGGFHFGHGRQVVIDHAGGFRSVYSHLSQVLVFVGNNVRAGQAIGRLGNSGRSTGPHLHFEINRYGEPLDPLELLGEHVNVE